MFPRIKWFNVRPVPLTDDDSRAMHEELDRREWAFESAVAEMSLPRFTTQQILERYLTVVAS